MHLHLGPELYKMGGFGSLEGKRKGQMGNQGRLLDYSMCTCSLSTNQKGDIVSTTSRLILVSIGSPSYYNLKLTPFHPHKPSSRFQSLHSRGQCFYFHLWLPPCILPLHFSRYLPLAFLRHPTNPFKNPVPRSRIIKLLCAL